MKKTLLNIVLAALCLNFASNATAQTPTKPATNQAIDVTSKGLQVGQQVPDLPSLAKYKSKLIILDFWATWCSPCIAMIPKLEALQSQFNDQIQIVSVTYQTEAEVNAFLNKKGTTNKSNLAQITDDKALHKFFPHIYLPHYIWIDPKGKVAAITGPDEISAANVQKMLSSASESTLLSKRDMRLNLDYTKPFLINGNGGDGSNLIYHSVLTGFTEGLGAKSLVDVSGTRSSKVVLTNLHIPWLFRIAYADGSRQFYSSLTYRVNVRDSSKLVSPTKSSEANNWLRAGNAFCYELYLPPMSKPEFFKVMREDLRRLFPQYTAEVKTNKVKCRTLIRTSNQDKIATSDPKLSTEVIATPQQLSLRNSTLSHFVERMQYMYYKGTKLPFKDASGYKNAVDLNLKGDISDIDQLNAQLSAYDLQIVERMEDMEILFIKDAEK